MPSIRYINGRYPYPAAAVHVPGAVVTRPDGTLAIYDDLVNCASGELISPDPVFGKTATFQKAVAGDNMAAGLVVFVIPASGMITATSTDNIRLGKLVQAAGVGVTHAHVNCAA